MWHVAWKRRRETGWWWSRCYCNNRHTEWLEAEALLSVQGRRAAKEREAASRLAVAEAVGSLHHHRYTPLCSREPRSHPVRTYGVHAIPLARRRRHQIVLIREARLRGTQLVLERSLLRGSRDAIGCVLQLQSHRHLQVGCGAVLVKQCRLEVQLLRRCERQRGAADEAVPPGEHEQQIHGVVRLERAV